MQTATLGPLGKVSRLTLGGGGIGQIWGPTDRAEARDTLHAAVEAGITLIDTAPMYGTCEAIIGETFAGAPPAHLRFTSKHQLGSPPVGETAARLEASLEASLATMRLKHIDLFFLHSNIAPDNYAYAHGDAARDRFSTRWSIYRDEVIPAFERLKAQGRIRAWGITGIGVPQSIQAALTQAPRPDVVQVITNLMDSAGGIRRFAEPAAPRPLLAAAKSQGVGVMGIRAVQAGALTAAIDRPLSPNHPDSLDYARAAPFRALCEAWGQDPALIAHRYALGMEGVDTLVLGVKNRDELAQALAAEAAGPLPADQLHEIEQLGLRT
ncbi:aldo/keto reductase [Phenylobacterium aquaticum]|uniref:aldo/keto reductase n=1 Tax=Phenylobacterium aquaticum TaxID=1763816 RepID=UPI0026F3334A|nr:aldo/keto reductase [Phenylobacterium aquaticum]